MIVCVEQRQAGLGQRGGDSGQMHEVDVWQRQRRHELGAEQRGCRAASVVPHPRPAGVRVLEEDAGWCATRRHGRRKCRRRGRRAGDETPAERIVADGAGPHRRPAGSNEMGGHVRLGAGHIEAEVDRLLERLRASRGDQHHRLAEREHRHQPATDRALLITPFTGGRFRRHRAPGRTRRAAPRSTRGRRR